MKNILTGMLVTLLLITMVIGCSKKESALTTDQYIDKLLSDIEIDLSKINTELMVVPEDQIIFESYKDDYAKLDKDLDSLLEKYPDSYIFKVVKLQFLSRMGNDAVKKFTNETYEKDSTNAVNKYLYGMSLGFDLGKDYFVSELKKDKENAYNYLGLAMIYLDGQKDDLFKPAKLIYLSIIKDPTNNYSFDILSYLFKMLNKPEESALLNGIILVKNPANTNAFAALFSYYIEKEDKVKAQDLMETFMKNNPDALTNSDIAEYYVDLDLPDKAINYIDQAKANNELNPLIDYVDAKIQVSLGNIKQGLNSLEKYVNVSSGDRYLSYRVTEAIFAENLYKEMKYINMLKEIENSAPTIGEKVPSLAGTLLDSTEYDENFFAGKVYLIDFWAAWCGPCKMEMPNVIEVYTELNEKGFEVIGVNLDNAKEDADKYVTENKIMWKHIYSGQAWKDPNVANFKVSGIPSTFLVDKNGIIRYKNIRGKKLLLDSVNKLLSE
ncbi:MAG: redoxin domain-containing protein [Candidatus Delongbacteria bacterium]|nr:redoxin domain-containing protein [Candidatus Delongbacteria bacterium]